MIIVLRDRWYCIQQSITKYSTYDIRWCLDESALSARNSRWNSPEADTKNTARRTPSTWSGDVRLAWSWAVNRERFPLYVYRIPTLSIYHGLPHLSVMSATLPLRIDSKRTGISRSCIDPGTDVVFPDVPIEGRWHTIFVSRFKPWISTHSLDWLHAKQILFLISQLSRWEGTSKRSAFSFLRKSRVT